MKLNILEDKELKIEENNISIDITIKDNCNVKIIETGKNNQVKILAGNNSNIKYISLNPSIREANLQENSTITWIDLSLENSKSSTITNLEKNSVSNSLNLVFGNDKEFTIDNKVIHKGNESKSDMFTRIVLTGKSKALHNGLVKINKNAVNCEGYQKSETILLSDNSYAESIPNLEIENNEVKCSHGSTISQIDEDKLFYMTSRGLSEKQAKKTIVEGFFNPILEELDDTLALEIRTKILENLK
tara:strand:- start:1694 stop:2428 length:735 start_codon:yes stop_codon:yes gene_type:complete